MRAAPPIRSEPSAAEVIASAPSMPRRSTTTSALRNPSSSETRRSVPPPIGAAPARSSADRASSAEAARAYRKDDTLGGLVSRALRPLSLRMPRDIRGMLVGLLVHVRRPDDAGHG